MPEVALSRLDERRGPVLSIVLGIVNSFSNTTCLLAVGGHIVSVRFPEQENVVHRPMNHKENR